MGLCRRSSFASLTGLDADTLVTYKAMAQLTCIPAIRSCAPNQFETACLTCGESCRTVASAYLNSLDTNSHGCSAYVTAAGLNYNDLYSAATAASSAGCSQSVAFQNCQSTFASTAATCSAAGVDMYGPSRCSSAQCMSGVLSLVAMHDSCLAAGAGTWQTTLSNVAYTSMTAVSCGCADHDLSVIADNTDGWTCSSLAASAMCTYDMGALMRSLDGSFVHDVCCDSCGREVRCEDQAECATMGADYGITFPAACNHPVAEFDTAQSHGNLVAYVCPASCSSCLTRFDECLSAPCENGGGCNEGIHSYSCNCTGGWSGENCAAAVDPCAANPCGGHGICTATAFDAFTCTCFDGFSGATCDTLGEDCASNPCQNGGVCLEAGFIPRPDLELESGTCGIDVGYSFEFIDITSSGTQITAWTGSSDDGYFAVSLAGYFGGATMPWYGNSYDTISVGTNGYLAFGDTSYTGAATEPLPGGVLVERILAPFWANLDVGSSAGGVYYGKVDTDKFVVEWSDVGYAGAAADITVTFEAVLYPLTGDVVLAYNHMNPAAVSSSIPSIGFMGHNGIAGHQIYYNVIPSAGTAVMIPAACHLEVGYACQCVNGWLGAECADEQRACDVGNNCMPANGEECVSDGGSSYQCQCTPDFFAVGDLADNSTDACPLATDNTGVGAGWAATSVRDSIATAVDTSAYGFGSNAAYVVTLRASSDHWQAVSAGPIIPTATGFTVTAWQSGVTPSLASAAGLQVTWMGGSTDPATCVQPKAGRTAPGVGWTVSSTLAHGLSSKKTALITSDHGVMRSLLSKWP